MITIRSLGNLDVEDLHKLVVDADMPSLPHSIAWAVCEGSIVIDQIYVDEQFAGAIWAHDKTPFGSFIGAYLYPQYRGLGIIDEAFVSSHFGFTLHALTADCKRGRVLEHQNFIYVGEYEYSGKVWRGYTMATKERFEKALNWRINREHKKLVVGV